MEQVLCNHTGHQPHCSITCWLTSIKLDSRVRHKQTWTNSFCKSWCIDSPEIQISAVSKENVVCTQPLRILFDRTAGQPTHTQFQINHGTPPSPSSEPWMQNGYLWGRTWEVPTRSRRRYYSMNCSAKSRQSTGMGHRSTGWEFLPGKNFHLIQLHFPCSLLLRIVWLHRVTFFLKRLARNR